MSDADKQRYLEFAKELALEAGEIMSKYFLATNTKWKADATPLTQADTEINSLVIERVAAAFRGHSVLGEEESVLHESRYAWVCDPVDGTMPYSHGLPISTFSLALCEDGVPQVGVVYDPFMKRLFYAAVGNGAFCNGVKMNVSIIGLDRSIVEVQGFGNHLGPQKLSCEVDISNSIKDAFIKNGAKVTQLWSSILPSALVAQGQYGAVVMNGKTIQDGAAIKVLVEEAGGRVTDIYGDEQRYDEISRGFIASNGIIHDELVKIVQEASR